MTENKRYIARDESIINMETGELVNAFDEWAAEIVVDWLNELSDENEQLKKELFESEKDYIMETYSDNPIRRDEKIQSLKEEFKARFGDVE